MSFFCLIYLFRYGSKYRNMKFRKKICIFIRELYNINLIKSLLFAKKIKKINENFSAFYFKNMNSLIALNVANIYFL